MSKAKQTWRIIPKRAFQAIAIVLLLACGALTVEVIWRQTWPFTMLLDWLGANQWWLAAFLTFLVLFLGWIIAVLPLRYFSQMPTYQEELEANRARNFKELYQQQREKMFLDKTGSLTPAQQVIRSRSLALGGFFLSFITGLATAVVFLISNIIWISGLGIALLGLILGGWHGLKSLWLSRRP